MLQFTQIRHWFSCFKSFNEQKWYFLASAEKNFEQTVLFSGTIYIILYILTIYIYIVRNNSNHCHWWLGFWYKKFKENIFIFFRKILFFDVTYVTSGIGSNTTTTFVTVSTKEIVVIYLDIRLKNRFIKFKFRNSYNSSIAAIGYISQFISFGEEGCWYLDALGWSFWFINILFIWMQWLNIISRFWI